MKKQPAKTGSSIKHTGHQQQTPQIKTEGPLSEKDEVKKAEERTRKAYKEHH